MINTMCLDSMKVVSRKLQNGLKRKAYLSEGILKSKTAKIFVSRLLELSLQKNRCKSLYIYFWKCCVLNIYQVCMTTSRKGASPELLQQRLDQERSL